MWVRDWLTGVAVGNIFSSPAAADMLAATKEVDGGAGVLYLFGNYGGDKMNFEMAAEMAEMEGIQVATSIVADDVASAPRAEKDRRRGVAGLYYAYKLAGAKAATMAGLAEVKVLADSVIENTCSIGVALTPCTSRPPASPISLSVRMKWRSGWVSTVSPASNAPKSKPPMKLP
jgi:dihydroxyacetone kinase